MFYHYEIKNNGYEDILYLYLDMKYEIADELGDFDEKELGRRTKNFIQTNNIGFKGKKVFLVIDGVVVKALDISKYKGDKLDNNPFSFKEFNVNIVLEDQSVCEISLFDFLLSTLLYYVKYNLCEEVFKVLGVLFSTYAYKAMKENNFISINDKHVFYKPLSFYRDSMDNYDPTVKLLSTILVEIDSMFLKYEDDYILPFIHLCNNGNTMKNSNYPYLSSVISTWDMASPYYLKVNDFSYNDFNMIFNCDFTKNSDIVILNKDNHKYVSINGKIYTIEEFRDKLDLLSTDLYIIIYNSYIRVITLGCGNFYGLSIVGANEIAKNGAKYYSILNYYFPKVKLYKYKKEL